MKQLHISMYVVMDDLNPRLTNPMWMFISTTLSTKFRSHVYLCWRYVQKRLCLEIDFTITVIYIVIYSDNI